MPAAIFRKTVDTLVGGNPENKAKFLVTLFNLAKEKGNKKAMRSILMSGWYENLLLTIDKPLVKNSLRVAKESMEAGVFSQVTQNEGLGETPQLNTGESLGAFSPEGAPLYK
jgi:hypothetical protein